MSASIKPKPKSDSKRPITIHLPEADSPSHVHNRTDAWRLTRSVKAPGAEIIAVLAGDEHVLKAFASGRAELVQAMIEDAYPFVCLIDLLESNSVWVFTHHDACDAVRRSIRKSLADRSGLVLLDVSETLSPLAFATDGAHS